MCVVFFNLINLLISVGGCSVSVPGLSTLGLNRQGKTRTSAPIGSVHCGNESGINLISSVSDFKDFKEFMLSSRYYLSLKSHWSYFEGYCAARKVV